MITSQKARRPDFKGRANDAMGHLRKAKEIASRDHEREDGIASHDIRMMTSCVNAAIDALAGTES